MPPRCYVSTSQSSLPGPIQEARLSCPGGFWAAFRRMLPHIEMQVLRYMENGPRLAPRADFNFCPPQDLTP